MLDLLVSGATVVDGSGAAPMTADVGVKDGRIVEVGRITGAARERITAEGASMTPGFVDMSMRVGSCRNLRRQVA